eukprot:19546_1
MSRISLQVQDFDLEEIDAILDEIEENEQKEAQQTTRKDRAIQDTTPNKAKKASEHSDQLSLWIRERWTVGSLCEVYSDYCGKWVKGRIQRIFDDKGHKWLQIQYSDERANRLKHVARDDVHSVRALSTVLPIYKYVLDATNQSVALESNTAVSVVPKMLSTRRNSKTVQTQGYHRGVVVGVRFEP